MNKRLLSLFLLLVPFVALCAGNFDDEAIYHDYVDGYLCYSVLDKNTNEIQVSGTTLKVEQEIKKDFVQYNVEIPDSVSFGGVTYRVTTIANNAFRGCSNLLSLKVGRAISYIGNSSFENCANLANVFFTEGLSYIGENAFSGCSNLQSVNLPKSVAYVGKGAFRRCSKLVALSFSAYVNELDPSVFEGCSNLENIWVDEKNPNMLSVDGVLYNKVQTILICCPDARQSALIIPRSVAFISWPFSPSCKLSCISCSSEIPPVASFVNNNQFKVSLFVPKRLTSAYQQDAFWSSFVIRPF